MNSTKLNQNAETAVLQRFIDDTAARRFLALPKDLSETQKYDILTEYVGQCVGEAWKNAPWHKKPSRFFLSFEYSFGQQTRRRGFALHMTKQLEELAKLMGSTYEGLIKNEESPKLGYGTLGRFGAAWMIESLTGEEAWMGYGLRYRSGFFRQQIIDNQQVESVVAERSGALYPWEIWADRRYPVRFKDATVIATAIDFPVFTEFCDRIHFVRLWDVEESHSIDETHFNEGEYVKAYVQALDARSLVEFLYPAETNEPGKKLRLMQEYFFASATVQDILSQYFSDPNPEPIRIYINEIHPILGIPEMICVLMEKHFYTFENAVLFVQDTCCYGNQILTDEAFEAWSVPMMEETIPHLMPYLQKMDEYAKQNSPVWEGQKQPIRSIFRNEQVHFYNIAAYFCRSLCVFSSSHKEFFEKRMGFESEAAKAKVKILPFIAPSRMNLKHYNPLTYSCLESGRVEPEALAEIKFKNKKNLAEYLREYHSTVINENSIYSVNIGNFHENNRQLLIILHIARLHQQLLTTPHLDIPETTFFFGGKAYPDYQMATEVVHLINAYSKWLLRDTLIQNKLRIVFIENFDVEVERMLLFASDVFQPLRMPSQATIPVNLSDALLHGSAVMASSHGYTQKIADLLVAPGGITLFTEENGSHAKGLEALRFLEDHKADLAFDVRTIQKVLEDYQDGFHVLGSFYDYHEKMSKLTRSYFNGDAWNLSRATDQQRMWKLANEKERILLPCDGR